MCPCASDHSWKGEYTLWLSIDITSTTYKESTISHVHIYMAIHGTQTLVHVAKPHPGQGCYGLVIEVNEPIPNTNISIELLKLFAASLFALTTVVCFRRSVR